MTGAGSVVGGVICLALGWAGFEAVGWMVVRRRDLGHEILTGDPTVLGAMAFVAILAVLAFAAGILQVHRGMRAWRQSLADARSASAKPAPARDLEWHRRRRVSGALVRTLILILAYVFFGGPALLFIVVPLVKDPTAALAALPLSAVLLLVVGALTYWWLRQRRYGDSACWLRTLPGLAGGRFEADVDCALPEGAEPVIVRLRNLVPAGKRVIEVWRMEERLAVPVRSGRTVVPVRLSVPRVKEQRFGPLEPGFREWLFGAPVWRVEVEKAVPGVDFLARFDVKMADAAQAPAPAVVPAPPDFGLPAQAAPAPLLMRITAGLKAAAPALAVSLAVGTAWLGYRDGWLRALHGPNAQWMDPAGFQREMNFWSGRALYPALIEMRCEGNVALYRSDWKPLPERSRYQAWSVMTRDDFARRDRDYRRSGYVLEMSGRFRTCMGEERISATWLERP